MQRRLEPPDRAVDAGLKDDEVTGRAVARRQLGEVKDEPGRVVRPIRAGGRGFRRPGQTRRNAAAVHPATGRRPRSRRRCGIESPAGRRSGRRRTFGEVHAAWPPAAADVVLRGIKRRRLDEALRRSSLGTWVGNASGSAGRGSPVLISPPPSSTISTPSCPAASRMAFRMALFDRAADRPVQSI